MMPNTQESIPTQKVYSTWLMLKITYGLIPIIAGADKFLNLLTQWDHYLSPIFMNIIPLSAMHIMYLVGVIEIAAGIIVLSRFTRYGAYIVALWLVALAVNLLTIGYFDIAVRDVVMAIGALALAQLSVLVHNR